MSGRYAHGLCKKRFSLSFKFQNSRKGKETALLILDLDIEFLHLQGTSEGFTTWPIDNGESDERASILGVHVRKPSREK